MKRLISTFLLLLFTFHFLGAGLLHHFRLYSAKKAAKTSLTEERKSELDIIKISKDKAYSSPEVQWVEEHEFRYRGEMYDVLKTEVHDGTIWFYCHRDTHETRILNELYDYINNFIDQKREPKSDNSFASVLEKLFIPVTGDITSLLFNKPTPFITENFSPSSVFLDVDSPPPRL